MATLNMQIWNTTDFQLADPFSLLLTNDRILSGRNVDLDIAKQRFSIQQIETRSSTGTLLLRTLTNNDVIGSLNIKAWRSGGG